mmetsp:Transcript_51334/g.116710  ORF Transcript_51334/g.116710 Transcript_51334/m.116710 type:complete len:1348 (+) Transcript_51334:1237-5280(+)
MWSAKGLGSGVRFTDFEILTAVALDPIAEPLVCFAVSELEGSLAVSHLGTPVARAKFQVLTQEDAAKRTTGSESASTPAAAAVAAAPADKGDKGGMYIESGSLYNHLRRFGYEYGPLFRLVERRTVPEAKKDRAYTGAKERPASSFGVLKAAVHVIPYLDNFLQLFLADPSLLSLPTLLREVEIQLGAAQEALEGSTVVVDANRGSLVSRTVSMSGLETMPAANPVHPSLVHDKHVFVPLGEHFRFDPHAERAFEATRVYTANQISKYCRETNPQVLDVKPWLAKVLAHALQWVLPTTPPVDEQLYGESLHYRMHVDLYKDIPGLLEHPFLTLSLHKEHDAFYETNPVVTSTDHELAGVVGLVRAEWHGTDLRVFEGGAGSCGFTRRVLPMLGLQLASYTCSDISAIRLGTLSGHAKITSVKHDLNEPLPLAEKEAKAHLILANNAIHVAADVARTLAAFRDALVDGGFVLLEEQISDACLYLWGLDRFIWETATDERSFGLWMSWQEWETLIAATEGLELICAHRSKYHVTMLLRKTPTNPSEAGAEAGSNSLHAAQSPVCVATEWSQIKLDAPCVFKTPGAHGLVKTLKLEEGGGMLKSLVDDGTLENLNLEDPASLPLTFNHVMGGKLGSLVVMPLACAASEAAEAKAEAEAAAQATRRGEEASAASGGGPGGGENVALHILRPGDLGTLTWIQAPTASATHSVGVHFASLNFKDVMYAFGKLRLEKPSFGLEFSGHDLSVPASEGAGPRRVMGIGTTSCIALRVKPTLTWEVPAGMTLEEAATVPVVYATALFALFEKANLKRGQTCLVHAGSGGVGHAAIYLCQKRGIEVFTTCAPAKRDYVKQAFGLDDAHVASSRDTSFFGAVLGATGGEGVDCVLNCLSGDLLEPSLQCVREFGNFCEIGKYDLQRNTRVGLKALERNVSYHAIDLAAMFEHGAKARVLTDLLADALAKGEVVPLPRTMFPAAEVEGALRYLSAAKHKGKVVLDMRGFRPTSAGIIPSGPGGKAVSPRFTTTGTHVVTGGLGGFGLELCAWLFAQGAQRVVVTSRSGVTTGWQQYRLGCLEARFGKGCLVQSKLDVVDAAQCNQLVAECRAGPGGLKGVWHVAMVLQDTLFRNMTAEKWDATNLVKAQGLFNLDAATRGPRAAADVKSAEDELDAFVAFSSVSSLFGNVGQANYSHANACCEHVVQLREQAGLKACAVQWGMIDNVGFFFNGANDAKVLETFLALQNVDSSLDSLHGLLSEGGVVTSYRLMEEKGGEKGEAFELSVEAIQAKFAEVLGGKAQDYEPDTPLNDYGLDSLSSIEVVNWMNRHITQAANPSFMTPDMTIAKMHAFMEANLKS